MSGAFTRAAATIAADRNLGADAVLTQAGAAWSPLTLRVALSQPRPAFDLGGVGVVAPQRRVMIPVSALPAGASPKRGDSLAIAGTSYILEAPERDSQGASWSVDLRS